MVVWASLYSVGGFVTMWIERSIMSTDYAEEKKNNIIVQRENIIKEERIWVRCYDLGYYYICFNLGLFDYAY